MLVHVCGKSRRDTSLRLTTCLIVLDLAYVTNRSRLIAGTFGAGYDLAQAGIPPWY